MQSYCFLDNKIIPENMASISCSNQGFLAGLGVYETLRTINQIPINWQAHYQRLKTGAKTINAKLNYSSNELLQAITKLLKKNNLTDARVRITLTINNKPPQSLLLIQAQTLTLPSKTMYRHGVNIVTAFGQRSYPTIKSTNMITQNILTTRLINKSTFEAIMTSQTDELLEGTKTNCFFVIDQKIYTPSKSLILYGTTAQLLEQLLPSNLHPEEKTIKVKDIPDIKEIFLTNSVIGILPVKKINNISLPIGAITLTVLSAYNNYLAQYK